MPYKTYDKDLGQLPTQLINAMSMNADWILYEKRIALESLNIASHHRWDNKKRELRRIQAKRTAIQLLDCCLKRDITRLAVRYTSKSVPCSRAYRGSGVGVVMNSIFGESDTTSTHETRSPIWDVVRELGIYTNLVGMKNQAYVPASFLYGAPELDGIYIYSRAKSIWLHRTKNQNTLREFN